MPWWCSVAFNGITGDAAENLATVVLEHAGMTDFCGIPLVSLRENTITELDLNEKGVGVPGAIVLSKLLPSAAAVKLLKCAAAPECLLLCQRPLFMSAPADRKANTLVCPQAQQQFSRAKRRSGAR